jgi:hypothetical protein
MRDRVVTCSKRQFIFCLLFIWLSNITSRLPRQTGVTGTHVTYEIFGRLHVEIFQRRFLEFSRSNQGVVAAVYKGQTSFSQRIQANSNRLVIFFSILCAAASLPCRPFVCHIADQGRAVSPNHRRRFDNLHGCRRIRFLECWKINRA